MKEAINRASAVLLLLVFAWSPNGFAKEPATRTVTILGGQTCKEWTKAHRAIQGPAPELFGGIMRNADISWLIGYASGINMASHQNQNMLRDLDADTLTDWTDRYCEKNMDRDVTDAVEALFKRLGRWP